MDGDAARRAFDPFYCGRDAGRGIGLGLPKALRLIESNGGGLAVESRPGEGTRVVVSLPMVVPAVA
jgi:signal transduction histidine kinase